MVWPVKTHPAHSTGLESKKNSSDGEGFSLDRSFYRTDISGRYYWDGPPPKPLEGVEVITGGVPWRFAQLVSI